MYVRLSGRRLACLRCSSRPRLLEPASQPPDQHSSADALSSLFGIVQMKMAMESCGNCPFPFNQKIKCNHAIQSLGMKNLIDYYCKRGYLLYCTVQGCVMAFSGIRTWIWLVKRYKVTGIERQGARPSPLSEGHSGDCGCLYGLFHLSLMGGVLHIMPPPVSFCLTKGPEASWPPQWESHTLISPLC